MNALMMRRRALMAANEQNKMEYRLGVDFEMFASNASYNNGNFTASLAQNFANTRRSFFSTEQSGNIPYAGKVSGFQYNVYPIPIPVGATKIKEIAADKPVDLSITLAFWNGSSWQGFESRNWIAKTDIDLTGKNYFVFQFRVDSSNTYFSEANTPTSVTVTFE